MCIAGAVGLRASDGDLFPYPVPPADMERLDERCDFIISRFWRQCDFKSAMSKSDKLRSTFADWVNLMPYATGDTVHAAIDRLIASVAKSGPHTLAIARMAEECVYSDSADLRSAEIFLPFAKAAAGHKKISAEDRAHYARMIQRIENTEIGKPVGHLEFVTPDGRKMSLDDFRTQMIVVVINSHDNMDSSMARVRLSADHNINRLIERGLLTVISVEPGKATPEWAEAAAAYPANWTAGAAEDAADWFELADEPTILLLDGRHRLLAKNLTVEGLMAAVAHTRRQTGM